MDRRSLVIASLLSLSGCAAEHALKADEEDVPVDGKADGIAGLVEHTSSLQEIHEIGTSFTVDHRAHAWNFHLGESEDVAIFTAIFSGEHQTAEVDTVIYLYRKTGDGWGRYYRKNDDASDQTLFSRIEETLAPGDYRIIVKAYDRSVRGEFAINLRCADGACDYNDPNVIPTPEPEPGTGTADRPGSRTVSFRAPILDENDEQPLSRFNAALSRAGLPTFPDYVTISSANRRPMVEYERIATQAARADVQAVTGGDLLQYSTPGALASAPHSEMIGLCYEGDGTALADFISGFADGVFSDMLGIYGWRSGTKSAYNEWHEPTSESGIYEEWNAFDANSSDVLVIYSADDDGNETTAIVPHCR